MKLETKLITPAMAKQMLATNTNNRNAKRTRIEKYASEMKLGLWKSNTGEFIKISENGRLIDGQHRLLAIINANIPVELGVITGLSEDVFSVIDTGANRGANDAFTIEGIKNALLVSTTIQSYSILKTGKKLRHFARKSNQEVLAIYNERPEFWQSVALMAQTLSRSFSRILEQSIIGSFMAYLVEKDEVMAKAFLNQLCTGNDITNPTILILRNKLIADKVGNHKLEKDVRNAYIIKTWNAFRTNRIIKVIKFDKLTEEYPIIL